MPCCLVLLLLLHHGMVLQHKHVGLVYVYSRSDAVWCGQSVVGCVFVNVICFSSTRVTASTYCDQQPCSRGMYREVHGAYQQQQLLLLASISGKEAQNSLVRSSAA
jgi:hypothetical protein